MACKGGSSLSMALFEELGAHVREAAEHILLKNLCKLSTGVFKHVTIGHDVFDPDAVEDLDEEGNKRVSKHFMDGLKDVSTVLGELKAIESWQSTEVDAACKAIKAKDQYRGPADHRVEVFNHVAEVAKSAAALINFFRLTKAPRIRTSLEATAAT
eukprot:9467152-Pyramimonas_sp.AAC.1